MAKCPDRPLGSSEAELSEAHKRLHLFPNQGHSPQLLLGIFTLVADGPSFRKRGSASASRERPNIIAQAE